VVRRRVGEAFYPAHTRHNETHFAYGDRTAAIGGQKGPRSTSSASLSSKQAWQAVIDEDGWHTKSKAFRFELSQSGLGTFADDWSIFTLEVDRTRELSV
jgi:hypothetical protein